MKDKNTIVCDVCHKVIYESELTEPYKMCGYSYHIEGENFDACPNCCHQVEPIRAYITARENNQDYENYLHIHRWGISNDVGVYVDPYGLTKKTLFNASPRMLDTDVLGYHMHRIATDIYNRCVVRAIKGTDVFPYPTLEMLGDRLIRLFDEAFIRLQDVLDGKIRKDDMPYELGHLKKCRDVSAHLIINAFYYNSEYGTQCERISSLLINQIYNVAKIPNEVPIYYTEFQSETKDNWYEFRGSSVYDIERDTLVYEVEPMDEDCPIQETLKKDEPCFIETLISNVCYSLDIDECLDVIDGEMLSMAEDKLDELDKE